MTVLLGMAIAPFPHTPASASCAGPYLEASQRLVLDRGTTTTVEGRAFVDGCQDSMGCSEVLGCSHCEYDEPTTTPLQDVTLRLRQGQRTWRVGSENADGDEGRVIWTFDVPAGVSPGRARLLPDGGGPLQVRIR